jgi:hypothetical protein
MKKNLQERIGRAFNGMRINHCFIILLAIAVIMPLKSLAADPPKMRLSAANPALAQETKSGTPERSSLSPQEYLANRIRLESGQPAEDGMVQCQRARKATGCKPCRVKVSTCCTGCMARWSPGSTSRGSWAISS